MLVTIGIVTHQRPDSLQRLLVSLGKLRFRKVETPQIRICVVDNDSDQSARPIVESTVFPRDWEVDYHMVPTRGLSHVRNRAIELALGSDFLAFIDDDQLASPQWMDESLATQAKYGAAVVWGRNVPKFDRPPDKWVSRLDYFAPNGIHGGSGDIRKPRKLKMGYFDPPQVATGGRCRHADTNNVLIGATVFANGSRFDEQFNSCGGEDRDFFARVARAGHDIVWANEAITYECIPPERLQLTWMMKREYAGGVSFARTSLATESALRVYAERCLKAVAHVLVGAAMCLGGVVLGSHIRGRGCLWLARGAGTVAGLLGGDCALYS